MSLFQKSVEKKYLDELNAVYIDSKYKDFQNYFGNPVIQENIRNAKEEQFQEGFLRELFVTILGYTLNPHPNFNLTTELKNIANSKKADGAILKGEDAVAVIELKGTDTTDLDKIETQAFGYKNHHPKCVYVITSNFEKLRFYIQNAVDHLDFDLFNLTREQFSLLWLCLAKDNLLNGLPQKIKESSVLQEENITKKLYADYSKFREAIYNNLVLNNPETDKLLLFRKTQKLIDRFLFIFFAEDRLLVPPNSISQIIEKWKDDVDFGDTKPLYDTFKKYFHVLNVGRPKSGNRQEIFAYNGGLFSEDEILDNINIDDTVLYEHTLKLSQYNYETDVDVNILGHIFEHSLGEIENVQAEIKGEKIDSQKTKRKKDGIFYTPKYITKYIVENTVGKLCEEKRAELGIIDEEYAKGRKNRKKETIKNLDDKLNDYRNWLLNLTILDPACGSGAFLNQALDFLITEHRKIDDLRAQLFGSGLVFSDITTDILEKNIYGVDINEESVEIAKLSLWLRTAQKGRKLNKLNNNIKCGNSLIDDPEVAGEKAFHWQNEFPNIFQKKNKKAWHITTATHNSRYSQRMFDNFVKLGEPVWFDERDEIIITETVAEIVKDDGLNILEYNICGDHMHILLVCEETELPGIVGKLKSVTAKIRNRKRGYTSAGEKGCGNDSDTDTGYDSGSDRTRGHAPLSETETTRGETQRQVWTQKFGKSEIKDEEYLANAIEYIRNNRTKHDLPVVKEIEKLKKEIICSREHAFRTEYKGGFDVVIGNPPYVSSKEENIPEKVKSFFIEKYRTSVYQIDLYVLFIEKSTQIYKRSGLCSFIVPNAWLNNLFLKNVRKYILEQTSINRIVSMPPDTFVDANVDTIILTITSYSEKSETELLISKNEEFFEFGRFEQKNWLSNDDYIINIHASNQITRILNKIRTNSVSLSLFTDIARGVGVYHKRVGHTKEFINQDPYQSNKKENETFVPYLRGKHVGLWNISWDNDSYISYGSWLAEPREPKYFEGERIVLRQIPSERLIATILKNKFITDQSVFIARFYDNSIFDALAVLSLITSKLLSFYFRHFYSEFDEIFPKVKLQHFKDLPINTKLKDSTPFFVQIASNRLDLTSELVDSQSKFLKFLTSKVTIVINNKLHNWPELDFKDFLKELQKAKIKLSISEEAEWMNYFNEQKQKAQTLKSEIDKTDREIDRLVYALYELTEEEIEIVESN